MTRYQATLYVPMKTLIRILLIPLLARVDVEGAENIPRKGAFFLIPNHQSVLDPIIVQAMCRRTVHSMTKSTQFASRLMRWLVPRVGGFPVRRYRTDPHVVRVVLRLLQDGQGVGIYPEGERSWDGTLQPLRRGTIRVLLKAGVPVIPVGIAGSYDVWPRWSRRPRRCRVKLRYGTPIHFGAHETRAEREAALPAAKRLLESALRGLIDETTGAIQGVPESASEPHAGAKDSELESWA